MKRRDFIFHPIKKSEVRESKKRTYTCTINDCNKVFLCKKSYDEHVFKVHNEHFPIVCRVNECSKRFRLKQSELEHYKKTHCKSAIKIKCPETGCKKSFVNASALKSHISQIHGKKVTVKCDVCEREVLKKNLKAHSKHCIGKMKCDKCKKSFSVKQRLISHIKHCNNNTSNRDQ